jgi:hypothetical protein
MFEYFSLDWNVNPEEEKLCRVVVKGFDCFLFRNIISEKRNISKNPVFTANSN